MSMRKRQKSARSSRIRRHKSGSGLSAPGTSRELARVRQQLADSRRELREALDRQAATSDILHVISRSPTDVQPVFEAIAESAARLCGASDVVIRQVDGNTTRVVAHFGSVPLSARDRPLTREILIGRAILQGRTIQVPDFADPRAREEYPASSFLREDGTPVRTV